MSLTPEQIIILGADINSHPELDVWQQDPTDDIAIAAWYNEIVTPDFIVWRNSVTLDEIMQNGFDWTQVDNTTVGKARIWEWLFNNEQRTINPSKPNVRAGINEAWRGTEPMLAVRAAIYVHCKRPASRIEKLFAIGTGTDSDPAVMAFEGPVGYPQVSTARSL